MVSVMMIVIKIEILKMKVKKIRIIRVKMVLFSFKSTTETCNWIALKYKGNKGHRKLLIIVIIARF